MVKRRIKALVVDDEAIARKGLMRMLEQFTDIDIIGEALDLTTCLDSIEQLQPEVVFMDIQLRDENVLSHLESLNFKPTLIFTTAYPSHALSSFQFDTLDYLLKPISTIELTRSIEKLRKKLQEKVAKNETHTFIKSNGAYLRMAFDEILYIKGMENYINIILSSRRVTVKSTMQDFLKKLPPDIFLRIHKSYIVNVSKISSVSKFEICIGETALPIGREIKPLVFNALLGE